MHAKDSEEAYIFVQEQRGLTSMYARCKLCEYK
jgi:hypothetical protein